MVVHELFVARRAVDHVVAVDHQQLGLIGVHRRDRVGDGLRKRIAAHAVGRGRNNRLGRALAKALGLGLGTVLFGHALLLPHELADVAAQPLKAQRRGRLGNIEALGHAALGKLGHKVAFLEHQARDAVALGAHDERHAALEGSIPAAALGVLGGAAHPKTSGLEVIECTGQYWEPAR